MKLRQLLSYAATVAILVAWWALFRPAGLGGPATYVVIRGDSMLPVYNTGDLVILHAAASYGPGDIVGYRVPDGEIGEGLLVVHRIVSGTDAEGFVLQGDNNPAPDPWLPHANRMAGTPWIAIPGVGRIISFLHQPAALAALAVSLLVGWEIGRRRPRPTTVETGAPPSPGKARGLRSVLARR